MAASRPRRGLVTTALTVVATTAIVAIAFVTTPSGPRPTGVEARGPLGHEVQQPTDGAGSFAPEALSELSSTTETPQNAQRISADTGVLRLVYFVEADAAPSDQAVELIEIQAEALQLFWYEQFGGTFALPADGVEIVYGDQTAQWYDQTVNGEDPRWHRLLNIQEEVRAKLSVDVNDDVRMVVYPATRLDGRVGAIRYNGAWMDGDDITCIDGSTATIPYAADYPANCLMTVAHELGHVYGLGHQGDDVYCMQFGFYRYINDTRQCDFSPVSRQMVTGDSRNQGWLDAAPGDRR